MKQNYDLIVVGGGPAGIGASVAAARRGLDVLLVEQSGSLGGAIAQNLIYPFMLNGTWNENGRVHLSRGIFLELCNKWTAEGIMPGDFMTYNTELVKQSLDKFVVDAGVNVLFHATLCDVKTDGRTVSSITVATKQGLVGLTAKQFVDATGDGDLMALSKCDFTVGREGDNATQPMTLCFRLANVNMPLFNEERPKITPLFQQFKAEGKIKNPREDVLLFPELGGGKNTVHFNTTRVIKLNPVDPTDLSKAEMEGREQMVELYNFLKENFECFRESYISNAAVSIGVRESRMLVGEHVVTSEELKACTVFEDSVAAGNYDIDIHSPDGAGTSHYYFPQGQYYTIPLRALLPKEYDNLMIAGRCISTTHEAQASVRIMPICFCTGEAAGIVATMAVKDGILPRNVESEKMHAEFDKSDVRYN